MVAVVAVAVVAVVSVARVVREYLVRGLMGAPVIFLAAAAAVVALGALALTGLALPTGVVEFLIRFCCQARFIRAAVAAAALVGLVVAEEGGAALLPLGVRWQVLQTLEEEAGQVGVVLVVTSAAAPVQFRGLEALALL